METPLDGRAAYRVCGCCIITRRRTALLVTLCLIFLELCAKEMGVITLPATLPAISLTVQGPVTTMLPAMGMVFYTIAKLSATVFTQAVGAKAVLVCVTCLAGVGLLLCAASTRYESLLVGWCLAQFACSHVWIASVGLVSAWVDGRWIGRVYGLVFSLGSEGGGVLGALIYSILLRAGGVERWRSAFALASGLLLCTSGALAAGLRRSAKDAGFAPPIPSNKSSDSEAHPLATAPLSIALRRFACMGRYWLCTVASVGFTVSFMTMQTFAALYATRRLGASASEGARLLFLAEIGSLIGGVLGGFARDGLGGRALVLASTALKLSSVVAACVWLWYDRALSLAWGPNTFVLIAQLERGVGPALFVAMASIQYSWSAPPPTINQPPPDMRPSGPAAVCGSDLAPARSLVCLTVALIAHACTTLGGPKHASTAIGIQDTIGQALRVPASFAFGLMLEHDESISMALGLWVLVLAVAHVSMVALLAVEELAPAKHRPLALLM